MRELRTKIGMLNVIGATVWNISIPISLWILNEWLKSFTYHIEPGPMIFVTAGLLTLFLARLITGYHSVKAALTNPVDVLKNE